MSNHTSVCTSQCLLALLLTPAGLLEGNGGLSGDVQTSADTLSPSLFLPALFSPRQRHHGGYLTLWMWCVPQVPPPSTISAKTCGMGSDSRCCGHHGKLRLGSHSPHVTAHTPPSAWCHHQGLHLQPSDPPLLAHPEPHLEQHTGHRGGPCRTQTVVGGAGIFSQDILIPQGNDQ